MNNFSWFHHIKSFMGFLIRSTIQLVERPAVSYIIWNISPKHTARLVVIIIIVM